MGALLIFSGFSLNLILHFALGLRAIAEGQERSPQVPLFQSGVLFIAVLLLWLAASYGLGFLAFGFLEYALLFPLSVLVCMGLEALCARLFPSGAWQYKLFTAASAYDGLVLTALILTLHIARTFLDALILSAGFSLGTLLCIVLLNAIRKRSFLELVPPFMQGRPLMLISLGLLSVLFTALGLILFTTLGIY
ncbi:MAG: hypothetical protein LBQ30_06025 [Treponema sp.]|jgi:electron transport complex protein RnfA|nr:hypothetical protein [Treponema sp.]